MGISFHSKKGILRYFSPVMAVLIASCISLPQDASDKCSEAYNYHWGRDWDKVIQLTTEAIEKSPEFPWPYSLRGVAYMKKGRYEDSIADLDTAIRLDPGFAQAYTNRAITKIRMGDVGGAERDINKSLEIAPGNIISMVTLAEVKSIKDNVSASCKILKAAVRRGFRDLESVEANRNFDNLFFSSCYQDILAMHPKRGSDGSQ